MQGNLQIRPFDFGRTFAVSPSEPTQQYRRKSDPAELAREVETLQGQLAGLEETQAEELARARTDAFEAGRYHERTERESAILSALDALQASLEAVADQYDDLHAEVVTDACQVALMAAEALAGRAIELEPGGAVDEAIGRALIQVGRGQEIEVKVHPDLVEEIRARIARRQSGDRRRLSLNVSADPGIAAGDAVLNWESGGVMVDAASRSKAVADELAPLVRATSD